jgi:hypothetical protein
VRITSPAEGAVVSGDVTISADAADSSGVKWVTFYLEDELVNDGSTISMWLGGSTFAPYYVVWDSRYYPDSWESQPEDGRIRLVAIATDNAEPENTSQDVRNVILNNHKPYTGLPYKPEQYHPSTSASFSLWSSEGESTFYCRLDGNPYQACGTDGNSDMTYQNLSQGPHRFSAYAVGAAGPQVDTGEVTTYDFTVDSVAPVFSKAPQHTLLAPARVDTSSTPETIPVKLEWTATDATSGIARYELTESRDAGRTWTAVSLSPLSTSAVRPLPPGPGYQYRVRAYDRAGLYRTVTGRAFTVVPYQETSTAPDASGSAITYSGPWSRSNYATFYGRWANYSGNAGATATFRFTGSSVSWVTARASNRGMAEVWLDGARVATLDLYSASVQTRQVVFTRSWPASGAHTLVIRALGQKRPAATNSYVDVDAFVVMR